MINPPDGACIDGDLMAFKAACSLEKSGIQHLEERLTQDLRLWDPGLGDLTVAFSTGRRNNYRRDFWPAYKSHRDGKASPEYLQDVIQWIKDNHDRIDVRPRIEADDIMGIYMTKHGATCVTKDKDLRSVPGWFWDPETGFPQEVTEDEADFQHHLQWLIGDMTDYIPGIYRFGKVKATKFLEGVPMGKRSELVMNYYLDVEHDNVKWKLPVEMSPKEEAAYRKDMAAYNRAKALDPKAKARRPTKPTTDMSGSRADYLLSKFGWDQGHGEAYALSQARCVRILRDGEWDEEAQKPILWTP